MIYVKKVHISSYCTLLKTFLSQKIKRMDKLIRDGATYSHDGALGPPQKKFKIIPLFVYIFRKKIRDVYLTFK